MLKSIGFPGIAQLEFIAVRFRDFFAIESFFRVGFFGIINLLDIVSASEKEKYYV